MLDDIRGFNPTFYSAKGGGLINPTPTPRVTLPYIFKIKFTFAWHFVDQILF